MTSCPTCNFCYLWHWHTIFGTLVYHHERMCQVRSWSWYYVDLWSQGQIYRVYDKALCSDFSFFVLWHSNTLFGTWVYHHGTMWCVHSWTLYDLDLRIDLKIKLYFQKYNIKKKNKIIFSPWVWVWQDVFALWHRHTKYWHMGVSPWDNKLCTFFNLVWPWPLNYM